MFSSYLPISSEGGDVSFQNNVPDPVTSGKELPTFKFELEKSEGRAMGGSYGKEATVLQLPISRGIAGVSMRMEPGVMRELHWHATAAEWAFVTEGRVRTTVIDPMGCRRLTNSSRATSGISHAATATSSRRWATSLAISYSFSITATSPNSALSALPTGLATPRRSCSPRISAYRRRPSKNFPRRRSISPRAKSRPPCRSAAPGLEDAAAHPQIQPACPRSHSKPSAAASSGASMALNSRFPRP